MYPCDYSRLMRSVNSAKLDLVSDIASIEDLSPNLVFSSTISPSGRIEKEKKIQNETVIKSVGTRDESSQEKIIRSDFVTRSMKAMIAKEFTDKIVNLLIKKQVHSTV